LLSKRVINIFQSPLAVIGEKTLITEEDPRQFTSTNFVYFWSAISLRPHKILRISVCGRTHPQFAHLWFCFCWDKLWDKYWWWRSRKVPSIPTSEIGCWLGDLKSECCTWCSQTRYGCHYPLDRWMALMLGYTWCSINYVICQIIPVNSHISSVIWAWW